MEKLKIHIGQRIKKFVKDNRISQAAWSRRQGVRQQVIWNYMKSQAMRIDTLFTISQQLKYNFLREIADQLPAEFPPHAVNPLQQRVAELEEEIKMLKRENEVLREVAGVKR